MGLTGNPYPFDLRPALQEPSTTVKTPDGDQIGLGWFLHEAEESSVVWKDGGLAGASSFVTFLQSLDPGGLRRRVCSC